MVEVVKCYVHKVKDVYLKQRGIINVLKTETIGIMKMGPFDEVFSY